MASLTEQEAAQYRRGVKDGREYTLRLVRQLAERMKKDDQYGMDVDDFKGTTAARSFSKAYNAALADLLNHLKTIVVI